MLPSLHRKACRGLAGGSVTVRQCARPASLQHGAVSQSDAVSSGHCTCGACAWPTLVPVQDPNVQTAPFVGEQESSHFQALYLCNNNNS